MIKQLKTTMLMAAIAAYVTCSAETTFSVEKITTAPGVATLNIGMSNPDEQVIVVQCDIKVPEGVTIQTDDFGEPIISISDRKVDHTISSSWIPSTEVYRLVSYSGKNRPFSGEEGVLFTAPLNVACAPGTYDITVCNILVTYSDLNELSAPDATGQIVVTEPEEVRYGDNQLYVKDITINEGEDAVMEVYYNSASDLHEYSTAIELPAGVTIGEVTYCDVLTSVNYNTESTFDNGVLTLSGEQSGTAKKPKPAEAGNHLFAQVALITDQLAAGEYDIAVGAQYLSNENEENDGEYNPDSYTARLIVVGASAPLEQCAMPEISVDEEGNLIVTCETDGTTMHTTINAVDHGIIHHANEEIIPLTGQYIITSYASAENMKDSSPATAMLVWTKRANTTTGVNEILAGTERALLIRSMGENVEITGTVAGEDVSLFNLSGTLLYNGKTSDNHTVIPVTLNNGEIYIIKVGAHAIKYLF